MKKTCLLDKAVIIWTESYFSIQGFLAPGPSAALCPIVLFLLSWSAFKEEALFPVLAVETGSVWITMFAAGRYIEI